MKKLLFIITLFFSSGSSYCQVFDVDTLLYNGDPDRFINLVILPDGYTSQEFGVLKSDAKKIKDQVFSVEPYKSYKNYFNLFLINVPSNESGINHPKNAGDESSSQNVPALSVDNYFQSTFDRNGVHRLLGPTSYTNVIRVLADNIPQYDFVVMVINTPYYGGAGGSGFAMVPRIFETYPVIIHELGHGLGKLADEYWDATVNANAHETYNMTRDNNPATIKWKEWLNTNYIGIYQHCCGTNSGKWYKPNKYCVMESNNTLDYCEVCREGVLEEIHAAFSPVEPLSPANTKPVYIGDTGKLIFKIKITQPVNPTIKSCWVFSGDTIAGDKTDSVIIDLTDKKFDRIGNSLSFLYVDTGAFLRNPNHFKNHLFKISWQLIKPCSIVKMLTFKDTTVCMGETIKIENQYPINDIYWSTTDTTPSIFFTPNDNKLIWTSVYDNGYRCNDTLRINVVSFSGSLSKDTIACQDATLFLTNKLLQTDNSISRKWFNGDTANTITITVDSTKNYWLSFTKGATICYDTILVKASPKINISPITGPIQLEAEKKGTYSVSNSPNSFLWSVINANATSPLNKNTIEIIAGKNGQIDLQVIEKNNYCSDTSALTVGIFTIPVNTVVVDVSAEDFKLYPNPAHNIVNISSIEALSEIKIFDISGKLIYSEVPDSYSSQKTNLNISFLKSGIYTVSIASKSHILNYKLIVSTAD